MSVNAHNEQVNMLNDLDFVDDHFVFRPLVEDAGRPLTPDLVEDAGRPLTPDLVEDAGRPLTYGNSQFYSCVTCSNYVEETICEADCQQAHNSPSATCSSVPPGGATHDHEDDMSVMSVPVAGFGALGTLAGLISGGARQTTSDLISGHAVRVKETTGHSAVRGQHSACGEDWPSSSSDDEAELGSQEQVRSLESQEQVRSLESQEQVRSLESQELVRSLESQEQVRSLGSQEQVRSLGSQEQVRSLGSQEQVRSLESQEPMTSGDLRKSEEWLDIEARRKSLVEMMAVDVAAEMSDVGKYSYAALCGVNLFTLFGDTGHNLEYFENFVKKLTKHLNLGKQCSSVAEPQYLFSLLLKDMTLQEEEDVLRLGQNWPAVEKSIQSILCGDGMDDCQPFVHTLQEEPVVIKHGKEVIIYDLVAFSLKQGCYDARLRVLIKKMCLLLRVDWQDILQFEDLVVDTLREKEHQATEEEIKEKNSRLKVRKVKKFALIGVATVAGGALLGLTGGLAAPFIAGAAGAIIGGAGAAALSTTAAIAIIGSLFGVAGAGLGAYKMKKRVGDLEEFEFEPLSEGRSLHLTIAVTGWITVENPDFKMPWLSLDNSSEQYTLKYESKYLKQLGQAMDDYLLSSVSTVAAQEALKHTVLAGLIGAIAWPAAIISVAGVLDNPWNVCAQRAVNAGRQLADVLLSREQGKRPVTLIGFSLGARVIFYCLQEMANRKNSEGIIEDVVMLGAPVTADPTEWQAFDRVVAGCIINGYCKTDWLLKFLYRTASAQMSIAGLQPVKWDNRRLHNIDITEGVSGHMDYLVKIDFLLDLVGIRTKPYVPPDLSEHSLSHCVQAQQQNEAIKKASTLRKSTRPTLLRYSPSTKHKQEKTGEAVDGLPVLDVSQVQVAVEVEEDEAVFTETVAPAPASAPAPAPVTRRVRKPSKTDDDLQYCTPSEAEREARRPRPSTIAGMPTHPTAFNMPFMSNKQKRYGLFFPDQVPVTFLSSLQSQSDKACATAVDRQSAYDEYAERITLLGQKDARLSTFPLDTHSGTSETDALPQRGESTSETDALPQRGESTSETDALPARGESTSETDTLRPTGESTSETDALPPTGESTSETDALPPRGGANILADLQ